MNPTQSLPCAATTATLERTIEWVDTDAAGHQHNSAVLRFVEACEAKVFRDLDLAAHVAQGATAATPWPAELAAKVTARGVSGLD